jgi:hypothetical protein
VNTSEVADLIAALRSDTMSLDEVAQRFRQITWNRTRQPKPQSYLEQAALANTDPEPDVPGSIDEVTAAYDRGELTADQYRTLARAVADSIDAEDRRRGGEPETSTSE